MRIGESIEGQRIDIDALKKHSGWSAHGDKVKILGENEMSVLATVSIDTLITCWIEKEEEAYMKSNPNPNPGATVDDASVIRIEDAFGNDVWNSHCTPENAREVIQLWGGSE